MAELSPDTLVHRRYRIRRAIASGGMGTLYEAFDEQLERVVAIKQNGMVLPPELFLSEAKLLARLHHPNLPAAIDVFEENQQQFFVMEFIEGRNLDQLLTARKRLPLSELGPWALQILDALDYLHTREPPVIHRDIKPSNLVLSQGTIYLVDFGISKDTPLTRLSGSGTRQYASPEHTDGPTTAASDLYSLSATLYHLLTGIPVPMADIRLQEVQKKGRTDPLVPAHVCAPGIGQAISAVLSKGLSLDPRDRFSSAAEMRDTLMQAIQAHEYAEESPEMLSTRTLLVDENQVQPDQEKRVRGQPAWLWWGVLWVLAVSLLVTGALLFPWFRSWPSATEGPPTAPATAVLPSPTEQPTTSTAAPAPSPTAPPEPTARATEPLPTPTVTLQPLEPVVEIPPPAAANTIRIALQSPISGEWGALGTGIRNGAELAVEQKSGPLSRLGYAVEFVPFDDKGNEEQGKANAQAITADPAVLCVVGHFNSGVTLAAQPLYEEANLVQISPGSTNPAVTDDTSNVWRVVGRDDVQGNVAAQFAREELQSQGTYIIHDNTTYGRGIAEVFRRDAEANGPGVVAFTAFDDSQVEVDFTPFLEEIQELNPDVIFFAGSYTRAGGFFKQARERGISARFLGSDSLDNPELATLAGDAVDGMHFTTVAAPVSEFPQAGQFAQDYNARYGQGAPPFSPESYDAAALCIEAIARAARASGRYPTREQVLDAMRTLPRFEGISGNYRFNQNGDPESVGYYVVQVNAQNWGENRVVKRILARPPG